MCIRDSPVSAEPGKSVVQLRQLHLELTFSCSGTAGKDVQNETRAVDDFRIECFLNISRLTRREFVIENDNVSTFRENGLLQFFNLSFADIGGRVRAVS